MMQECPRPELRLLNVTQRSLETLSKIGEEFSTPSLEVGREAVAVYK